MSTSHKTVQTGWLKGALLGCALPLALGLAQQAPEAGKFSVAANLVELHVTARDRSGKFVTGLTKEDFHLFEDGRPQTIRLVQHEDLPVSVGLIVDNSASMRSKRKDVTVAALAFVRSSNPQDEIFIVNFNERVSLGLPPEKLFSTDTAELEAALNRVPARGMTALYDAIHTGLVQLEHASRERKVLIVISDGGDNASTRRLQQVLAEAQRPDTSIYTIGLFDVDDRDRNPAVLKTLARTTGGTAFVPHELEEVVPICERIAVEIRNQYTIDYAPSNRALDNTFRKIRVTAGPQHRRKIIVSTREGYLASPAGAQEQ